MTTSAVELSVDVKSPRTSSTSAAADGARPSTRADGAALPSPGPTQPGHLTTSFVDTAIQMQRDLRVTPKWLIDPRTSKRMGYWDFTTVMALLFTALVTPFEVAFLEPVTGDALYVINWVVNGIFIVDMVFQFCMIYPSETAEGLRWVDDPRLIALKYLKGWFVIDFVSVFPIGAVAGAAAPSQDLSQLVGLRTIRLLRLIKLVRLVRASRMFKRWESRLPINYGTLDLVKMVVIVLVGGHWCAMPRSSNPPTLTTAPLPQVCVRVGRADLGPADAARLVEGGVGLLHGGLGGRAAARPRRPEQVRLRRVRASAERPSAGGSPAPVRRGPSRGPSFAVTTFGAALDAAGLGR